jgi:hypothetical protein
MLHELVREQRAQAAGWTTSCVNPKAEPPVCKLLDFNRFKYDKVKDAALRRRGPAIMVFLVRSKLVVRGRPGAFLVGDLVTGDVIRSGMVARIPGGPDVFHLVTIVSVEFVDHMAEKTSELALHVLGGTPEQVAAIELLEGAHLIEIGEG